MKRTNETLLTILAKILQKLSKTTNTITTHLWLGSITIVYAHGEVEITLLLIRDHVHVVSGQWSALWYEPIVW